MGTAGAGAVLRPSLDGPSRPGSRAQSLPILPLTSTSEVFTPGNGRGFMKFSFDFPEPSVEFEGYRFGFLLFTRENAYGLDARRAHRHSRDRKSTRLNSSHSQISYAVFCLKKKTRFLAWSRSRSETQARDSAPTPS